MDHVHIHCHTNCQDDEEYIINRCPNHNTISINRGSSPYLLFTNQIKSKILHQKRMFHPLQKYSLCIEYHPETWRYDENDLHVCVDIFVDISSSTSYAIDVYLPSTDKVVVAREPNVYIINSPP